MPIIGMPVLPPSPPETPCTPPDTCDAGNKLTPEVSRYYDQLVLRRLRSVTITAGQHAVIEWFVVDSHGVAVDLTTCGFDTGSSSSSVASGSGFRFRIRENLSLGFEPAPPQTEFDVQLVDAAAGKVRVVLPRTATGLPGVYFAELGVFANLNDPDNEQLLFSNVFYVVIQRGQYGSDAAMTGGPPTIQEIRLHLRDSGAEENLLLDNIKFDDAEIALAISRPVQYWNEIPPDLNYRYTTQNFPWRYHWLEGICANLFWMVAEQFRANNLKYSAAGVQVDDQNKQPDYAQAAQQRDAEWKTFVRRKKSELNLTAAFGGIGSPYARY